jgi:enoyl-CoA hydratase/carnithine racemase
VITAPEERSVPAATYTTSSASSSAQHGRLLEFTRMTCELIQNIRALPKPVIASLNGTTAGAGACIALASDIRIASEEAKIAFLFVKVGLAGTTWRRLIYCRVCRTCESDRDAFHGRLRQRR